METGLRDNFVESTDLISSGRVRGTAVYDNMGERLGTIDDIMIGKVDGEVAYAVMSFGGFLGIGEKYHPLPWDALEYDTGLEGYRVGSAGENFRDAPAYSYDQLQRDNWRNETEDYYAEGSTGGWLTRRPLARDTQFGREGGSNPSSFDPSTNTGSTFSPSPTGGQTGAAGIGTGVGSSRNPPFET